MELSDTVLAVGKLIGVLLVLLVLLRLHVSLWLTILAAALVVALSSGIYPPQWPAFLLNTATQPDFLLLCTMIFLIMLLSAVQDASGQSARLVDGLKRYLTKPRIRLVIFPALVGLLPMPGGALFSCPMIEAAAKDMAVTDSQKALINYWFRHIWEVAWPLYPGYALVSSLLGIPMTVLWQYTFPLVFLSFGAGWFCYMRTLSRSSLLDGRSCDPTAETTASQIAESPGTRTSPKDVEAHTDNRESLGKVLLHALPIGVTLVGAGIFAILFDIFFPALPGQLAFTFSLLCAVSIALFQGRGHMSKSFGQLLLSRNAGRILLLLLAVFLFKECVRVSGIVEDISQVGDSNLLLVLAFIIVPLISGLLTGIMVAFVGLSFPLLLGLLEHSPMKEYLLPLTVLGLVAGNSGQMISPLHVCLVVTCEFFKTRLLSLWRSLLLPFTIILTGGIVWALFLALVGAHL